MSGSDAVQVQYLKELTRDGRVFDFAANLLDDKQWAGATFTSAGDHLFVPAQLRHLGTVVPRRP